MTRRPHAQGYSLRELQSLLGVSRRVLTGLIDAGFVSPARGRRNELRFSFQDVVLLRTAFQLQSARIPSRRILHALRRIRQDVPEAASLSGVRITAVGDSVAVKDRGARWRDASSGQLLLDFGDSLPPGDVTAMHSAPASIRSRRQQAADWYALAEQLQETDVMGAEKAYRKALSIAPEPYYFAYANLGALLSRDDARCSEALAVFEEALSHFEDAELLHYNRGVLLEGMNRVEEAAESYRRCITLNPHNEDAICNHALILDEQGKLDEAAKAYIQCLQLNPDHTEALKHLQRLMTKLGGNTQAVIRHLSAWRRAHST
ncbi:tetratricopeptide repeat protein [Paraburkholderia sp. EG287A]|uniref:tetratricopeptide repeat protein n=1 Tax=Paraburkholderia sp. EG287A TaxID=3237012 RepID=UPI0034D2CD7B